MHFCRFFPYCYLLTTTITLHRQNTKKNSIMKKLIFLLTALLVANSNIEAQRKTNNYPVNPTHWPINRPHHSRRNDSRTVSVMFDASSTVLTVKFPNNSNGNTVEVYHDGAKVTRVTTNGGTTFSCTLRDYGTGSYNIIVSNGNTVIDSKNYTVK